jgi:hypothetical protein
MATSKTRSSNGRSKTARTSGSRAKSSERDGSGGLDKAKLTLIAGGSAFVGAASGAAVAGRRRGRSLLKSLPVAGGFSMPRPGGDHAFGKAARKLRDQIK